MRLKKLRLEKGISQIKLAMDLHLAQNSISRYENGTHEADYKTLIAIADYFNVSVDYLLGRNVSEQSSLSVIDVTGLTADEISHIKLLVDDLREHKI